MTCFFAQQNEPSEPFCGEFPAHEEEIRDIIISRYSDKKVLVKAGIGKLVGGEISRLFGRPLTTVCIDRGWTRNLVDIRDMIPANETLLIKAYKPYIPEGPAIVQIDSMVSRWTYTKGSNILLFHETDDPRFPGYGPRYFPFSLTY